jgi:hypothetical protein
MKPKRAETFLRAVGDILAQEENLAQVFPIRATEDAAHLSAARRGAVAMYRDILPSLISRLPR